MSKKLFGYLMPLLLFWIGAENSIASTNQKAAEGPSGTLERMIIANGTVVMNLDSKALAGDSTTKMRLDAVRFNVRPNSFFTVLIFNNLLRGPEPSSMSLTAQDAKTVPAALSAYSNHLMIEKTSPTGNFDLVVRDGKSGLAVFNIEGHHYNYDAAKHLLNIAGGRLLISPAFAQRLGVASQAGAVAGNILIAATVYPIEIDHIVNGEPRSMLMPPLQGAAGAETPTQVQGPDVIVGDVESVVQFGTAGTQVGLAAGTDSCNNGNQPVDWFALPNTDHPVVPQNLYRMSGAADNTERFEQVGQSWMKHTFLALEESVCGTCNTSNCQTGSHLCPGCSDPYTASLNGDQGSIGSRAWVNPFTGNFQSGANSHSGHVHNGVSHRIRVETNDLNTTLNPGATYFAEAAYISPHEYAWCQAHPGQCNMYNNVSYRQFTVSGTTSFTFSPAAATVRTSPAILAWTNATINRIEPAPGNDGIWFMGYKVSNPSAGVWHYEYALYNQNLDRAIQSFSVPLGCGITTSNVGFHAPPQEPGWTNDGTFNNQGYSSVPWTSAETNDSLSWNCETFAQNQNANAIRWGTLYNFRFDSNKPPTTANATVGFFKTGSPITLQVQAPMPDPCNPLAVTSVVSRKTHGAAGDFDVDLPLSGNAGVECRSSGGNHTLVYTFTNDVVSGAAAVTSGVGTVSGNPTFSGNTMTVNLSGVSDQQQITVTVSNVMDTFGQTLPDTAVNAVMLIGDTNANRSVNSSDVAQTKSQVGATVDSTNFRDDINVSGGITSSDLSLVKATIGNSVP